MSLTSYKFLFFTLIVLLVYYLMPKKYRWTALLCASMGYYLIICYKYIGFILITIVSTFFGGKWLYSVMEKSKATLKENKGVWSSDEKKAYKEKTKKKKYGIVALILVFNFGILAFLKYFNFFADVVVDFFGLFGLHLKDVELGLILPLGISFYTFQSMGYIIDIYRSQVKPEKNIAKYALFVSFFPQIIQGPISFYSDLSPQLYNGNDFDFANLKRGAELVLWGFFKKLIIADRLLQSFNAIIDAQADFSGTYMLVAVLIYAIQLYTDFSGGIDITRGIAEMFGIHLAENFKRPYFAKSISDYWRRWHITLGAWLRNYLFYPIAMSKAFQKFGKFSKAKFGKHIGKVLPTSIASLITFLVVGIWHGANGKYVAFGIWNGVIIMISTLLEGTFQKWMEKLKISAKNVFFIAFQLIRTLFIVLVGYYFDIAENFSNAMNMMFRSVSDFHISDLLAPEFLSNIKISEADIIVLGLTLTILFIASLIQERTGKDIRDSLNKKPFILQCIVLLAGVALVLLMGVYGPGNDPADFVYMQF